MRLMTFANSEYGILVHVNRRAKDFSVTVQDAESGAFLPTLKIFPEQGRAIHYAKAIIAGKEPVR